MRQSCLYLQEVSTERAPNSCTSRCGRGRGRTGCAHGRRGASKGEVEGREAVGGEVEDGEAVGGEAVGGEVEVEDGEAVGGEVEDGEVERDGEVTRQTG